jgi:UDP:flavonoid glycosyltransferase YjiC (YdhE family)
MATYLAYTSPAAGHLFPLVPGLLELRRRGHDVHVRTAPDLVGVARAAGLSADPVDARILDVPIRDHEGGRDSARLRRGLAGLIARGPYEREDLARDIAERRPDAVLVDTNAYGAAVEAERSGLPWATTLPSLLPLPGRGVPPYGLGLPPRGGLGGRIRDRVGWAVMERLYGRAMLPPLNALRAEAGLRPLRSPLEHVLGPDRLIVLTGDPFEYPRRDLPPHVRMVGAQNWDPPDPPGAAAPDWLLEPGDPWVLVTCSTDYQGDERLAATAVDALRDEPVRVLLTLADAYDSASLPAAGNVRRERFVAHAPVLERAAAVVCHGGMGIVQKAVGAGVPVVAVPFGRDQPEVARRLTESGAGVTVRLRDLEAGRLRAAVRETIALRPAAEAAARRQRDAGGAGRFADAVEELSGGEAGDAAARRAAALA